MACLLWFRKDNTRSNVLLGMFLFYAVSTFLNNTLIYTNTIYYIYPLVYCNIALQLLTGPTLLLYFSTLMGRKMRFQWHYLLHVIPAIGIFIFGIQQGFIPYEQKVHDITEIQNGTSTLVNAFNQLLLFHALFYFTATWFMQKKYRRESHGFYTNDGHTMLIWIKYFLLMLISINVLCILGYGIQAIFFPSYYVYVDMIMLPVVSFLFYLAILIQAFNNHTIFTRSKYEAYQEQLAPFNTFLEEKKQQPEQKYGHTVLSEQVMDDITERIGKLFSTKELYTDKELSLQKLAENLDISSHQLSQFINRGHLQNFSDFINSYRIEKAKALLTDLRYSNYSIEGIGKECGFNTRTTFYAAFRKQTGTTPVGYKKSVEQVLSPS